MLLGSIDDLRELRWMVHTLRGRLGDARSRLVMTQSIAGARTLAGSCQCGAVTYAVADAFLFAVNCHCSICRRATGSAFKPLAGIERSKLRFTGGQEHVRVVDAGGWHDERCGRCGSLLFAVVRAGTFVHVAMGSLVDEPTIRPSAHVFVGSKAPWFDITDDLPQYDGHLPCSECDSESSRAVGTPQDSATVKPC